MLGFGLSLITASAQSGQPGDLDPLNTNIVGNGVLATAVQPDGKTVIGGTFTSVLGVPRNNIARLNADGTLDVGYDPNADNSVYSVAVQTDGKVLLGGDFATVNGTARSRIARVNADGTLDTGFDPKANNSVRSVLVQTDGKILLGGFFTTLQPNGAVSTTPRSRIARVDADGTLDTGFDPKANNFVFSMALQADGRVLLGGIFTTLQPNGAGAATARNNVARVNADGTLDTGFDPKADGAVLCLAVQADGKVLLGGGFTTLQPNGAGAATARQYIARVNADGTLDTGFDPKTNNNSDAGVASMAVQADGKVLLGGSFTTLQPNGAGAATARQYIARVNADGTLDTGFDPKANAGINGVTVQVDGKILIGGGFTTLQPNGAASPTARNRFARLINDSASQTLSAPNSAQVLWQRGGASPELNSATFEKSTDGGANWSVLGNGVRVGATSNWQLTGLSLPASGQIRARGRTSGGYANGSSGLVESLVSYALPAEIAVEQPALTNIVDGASKDFSGVNVGSTADLVFTIKNSGGVNLTLSGTPKVVVSGTHASLFTVTAQPTSPVAPAGSTTFTVRFAPTSTGAKTAALSIANDDADENPFDIQLTGTGLGAGPLSGTDNFNDNSKDPTTWAAVDQVIGGASLVEANGRLEYRVTTPDAIDDEALRPWALNIARNTDAFDVILDVFNNVNPAGAANASIGLTVTSLENSQDSIYVELYRSGPGGDGKGFLAALSSNVYGGNEVPPITMPTSHPAVTTGSVRLLYNPTTKVFTAYYDATGSGDGFQWQSYGTFGVGDAPGNGVTRNSPWQLSGNKGFIVSISGFSETLVVGSGSVYADNFTAATTGFAPEIVVEEPVNTSISTGATVNFGTTQVGSGNDRVFTVRNTGTASLTGLAASITSGSSYYNVTSAPATTVAPGGSTTLTVRLGGLDSVPANGTLSLASTDSDENPFIVNLTGAIVVPPSASTNAATSVTHVSATLNGTVGSVGASATVTFDYGLTTSYGSTATAAQSPVTGGFNSVSAAISGLLPSTTYHFRVRASNFNGNANGNDLTFTTRAIQPGDLDTLNPNIVGSSVYITTILPDGKTIIAGSFTSVYGVARNHIARLNADGTLDSGFDPKPNSVVYSVAVQADGKVLLGGQFTTLQPNGAVSATTRNRIARVNVDGTLDTGFNPNTNDAVTSIEEQADGKVLLGGWFTTLQPNGAVSATTRNRIARVNADGTLDTGFDPNANGYVISVAVQADGKVLLGGQFTSLQPNGGGTAARQYIARVNADGTLDTGFDPKCNNWLGSMAVQPDGKVLLGGQFTTLQPNGAVSATARQYVARVNADGTLDTSFDPKTNNWVRTVAVQTDGKVLLGGDFTTLQPNGAGAATSRIRIARVNGDGTLDSGFDPSANASVYRVAVQTDGKVLIGGNFTTLQPNGAGTTTTRSLFARLVNDAAIQTLTIPDSTQTLWTRSGAGPELSRVTFELSTNGGVSWSPLGAGTRLGTTSNWQLTGLALSGSAYLRARGHTTGDDSGLIEQVISFGTPPVATTAAASNVTSVTATLNGTVNPNLNATTVTFEYGLTTGYGSSSTATLAPVSGSSVLAVSATLSGLTPGATYHYRLVGVNGAGTSNGADMSFTAASTLHVPRNLLTTLPAPSTGAQTNAQFGVSVAVDGIYTVVGAPLDDTGATDSGVVKVYHTNTGALLHLISNPDPASSDVFGFSVSISGTRLVVGCHQDDTSGTNSGRAYVFNLSGQAPTVPVLSLANPTPASSDAFGYAVALDGRYAVVSAWLDDAGAANAGSVYVYDLDGSTPTTPLLTVANPAPAVDDNFGMSVAISGNRFVVGAWQDDTGAPDSGSAYVYDITSSIPSSPVFTLANPGPDSGDFFGRSVSISGVRVIVGAREDDTGALNAGICYVYDLSGGTPTVPVHTLTNPFPNSHDQFGTGVAISGTWAVVGAYIDDVGATDTGRTYVYDLTSGTPTVPAHYLDNPAPENTDWFGYYVAVSGTRLVVGAPLDNAGATDAGSAYIYDLTSGTPTVPTSTLNSPGPSTDDRFGAATALSGTRTVVGMPREDTGASNAGSVFVYDSTSGTPTVPVFTLSNPGPAADDNFGNAVAVQGSRVLVGAPFDDTTAANSGAAYFYDLSSGTPTVPVFTFINPVPGANDNFGNSVALEGTLLVIGAAEDDTSGVDTGSVYVYDLASATPTVPIYVINNPSPASGDDSFGNTMGISGRRIVIAALSDDPSGIVNAGSVYAYDLNSGTPTVPLAEIFNPLPASGDFFGWHAAISGTRIVVGALSDDTLASDAGAAYVYDLTSGTPTVPVFTLPNPTPVAGDNMGHSVAIAGNWVAVGASNDGTAATGSGTAYFYDLASASPTIPVQTLPNPSPSANDDYGLMMAMEGQRFVVGSPFDDMVAVDKGAAYVFGPSSTPEIAVELLGGASLADATSTVNFGYSAVGFGSQKVFRITNLGGVDLTGLALSVNGSNAADFTLGALGSTTLAPGASTTFTVTFTAGAAASRMGDLHITSNDADESPFDIALTGAGQPGSVDLTYDPQMVGGVVYAGIELPSGKLMIGGDFETIGGVVQRNLARLNADGTLDTSFTLPVSGRIECFTLQADGKLLIGGSFTITSGGQSRGDLARLNTDGSLDTSLPELNISSSVDAIVVQADGKIVFGGYFTSVLGQTRSSLARVNVDGTLDAAYNPNVVYAVDAMIIQTDGKVVIGGQFNTVSGTTRNQMARVNIDGTLDTGYDPNVSGWVMCMSLQSDGKTLIGGSFSSVGGTARNNIARVNTDGTLDTSYNPNINSTTYSLALQSDGKAVVGGSFTTVLGGSLSRRNLLRLNTDGVVDSSFNPSPDGYVNDAIQISGSRLLVGGAFFKIAGQPRSHYAILDSSSGSLLSGANATAAGGTVYAQSLMPDGKLVVGGFFIGAGDLSRPGLLRLMQNGGTDASFDAIGLSYSTIALGDGKLVSGLGSTLRRSNANGSADGTFTGTSANNPIYTVAMQADGKVVVGGYFTTYAGATRNKIARVNANGTLDTGFDPNADINNSVYSLAVQPDGKILVGGSFTTMGGVTRNRLARLNADGTLDTAFNPAPSSDVYALIVQPDGKILVGGIFSTIGGVTRNRLARLNPDGSVDSFNPNMSSGVFALALQTNRQILAAGGFATVSGVARTKVARINADGTLDSSFVADVDGTSLFSITQSADGSVHLGGRFASVNGVARNGLAKLANTPAMQSLTANSAGTSVTWVRAGSSPEVDRVTFESSLDGSTWTSLGNGTRTANGWQLTGLLLPTGQSYQVRAQGLQMTGGYYGGDSSIYETVALMPASAAPEIVVEQPVSTPLTDAVSTTDFGSVNLGSSMDRTFTIRNTGSADLTGLAVTVDGPHAADFSLISLPAPAVAAGGSTAFTVRFTSTVQGTRFANLHVWSNDADEMPFDLNLIGEAVPSITPFAVTPIRTNIEAFALLDDGKLLVGRSLLNGATVDFSLVRFNQDHTLDTPIAGFSAANEMRKRPDGKVWVANSTVGSFLRLLNADGTLATGVTFPQPNSSPAAIVMQPDGKTLIGGSFTDVGGTARNRLARINADFTLDTGFDPNVNGTVSTISVQPDGKILIGGSFTTVGGVTRNRLARINADGTLDTTFDPNVSSTVSVILLLPDGTIIAGGSFTTVSGQTRNRMVRLNADGTLDLGFNPNANNSVLTLALQADGKVVMGGTFTTIGGVTRNRIARLNADGSLDTSYDPNADNQVTTMLLRPDGRLYVGGLFINIGGQSHWGAALLNADGTVDAAIHLDTNGATLHGYTVQTDGKIIISGVFDYLQGQARNGIGRLHPDGSLDMGYAPTASYVFSSALQSDGKLVIGGRFTSVSGLTYGRIARLYENGTVDTSFVNPNANDSVYAAALQPDGKILIGGIFTTVGGITRNRIARLNANGSLDTSFDPNLNGDVNAIHVLDNGQILIGGSFTLVGADARNRMALLNADGSLDGIFNPNINGTVNSIRVQKNGQVLIGGSFTSVGAVLRLRLARLNADGSLDGSFNPNANSTVLAINLQADGKIFIGGGFTSVAGMAWNRLARLNTDGSLDTTLATDVNNDVIAITGLADGRWLIGGEFNQVNGQTQNAVALLPAGTAAHGLGVAGSGVGGSTVNWTRMGASPEVDRVNFESSLEGSNWTSLGNGNRTNVGWQLTGQTLPDGQTYYLRAQGRQITGGQYGGSSSIYEDVTRVYSASGGPEIAVEQPASTPLADGASTTDFGSANLGAIPADRTYVIRNTGAAPLTGLSASFDGPHALDFSLVNSPASIIASGDSTTFIVRFSPKFTATRTATLSLWSNDTDENPFEINLTGNGVASAPAATTLAATFIQSDAATLNGSVSDNGASTTISFDYGLTTSYGSNIAATPASLSGGGTSATAVSRMIDVLTPSTTYHFRVRAVNSSGTTLGDDVSFTTPAFSPGEIDVGYNPTIVGSFVSATSVQPDGKIIIGGNFTTVNGIPRSNIARLNADGSLDTGFDPKTNGVVYCVAVQPDGKILLGGVFTTLQPNGAVTSTTRWNVARVNADGSLDTGFDPKADAEIDALVVQADGKILIGGGFSTLQPNGAASATARWNVARVNADGTLDTGFDPKASFVVDTVTVQADGKILLGGLFTTLQPNGAASPTTRNRIARLNTDGSLDTGFDPQANGQVNCLVEQADGKILIGGTFTTLQPNGAVATTTRNRIARVNADGSLDEGFDPQANGTVYSVSAQANGKVLLGGLFTTLQPNGAVAATSRQRIARINSDGSLDTGFDPKASGGVYTVAVQADGDILLGGTFTTLQPNGASSSTVRDRFARLNNDAATQTLAVPNASQVEWQRGGASPEVSLVTFERSIDAGATWVPFGFGTRIGTTANWQLTGISLPSSGQIRARGRTVNGIRNGGSGLIESIQSYSGLPVPEITVFNGSSTAPANERQNNTGTFAFADTDTASSSAPQTFTIQNTGTENLTGLVVSLAAPGDFTFTQPAVTTLTPGATTTFTATFSPILLGAHTATLRIASNDFDENPFDIALSGTGVGSLRDNYANRLNLGNAATVDVVGSNRNATIEPGENTFGGITGASVWAQWTAPTTGWVTINTVDSPLDTQIGLYTGGGTLAGLSLLGYNDESRRPTDLNYFGSPRDVSRLVFMAQAGTTYTISVGGQNHGNQETGTFELHIAPEPTPPVRVMGVSFTPNSADVTSAEQPATMQLSVDSNSALFPDSYLDATIIRPDSGQYGSGLFTGFQDSDRVSGTVTSGIYEQLVTLPRYVPGGAWPVRVSTWSILGDGDYTWSTQGDDLLEDFYLIPPPANSPLPVTNTGAVDSTAPTLVSISGVPPVVDVTTGDVTFDVDITFTDGLSGLTSADFFATNDLVGNGVYYSSFGTIVSGDEFSGVFRQTITLYQGSQSGTYYPVITLNDAALNQRFYSDYGGYGERISAPGSDLTFQVIGVEPEIEVEAPGGGALTDGGPGVDFGSASVAMTAASYDFSGSFMDEFSLYLNEGTGTAIQSGGALRYHAADGPGESNAAYIHRDFQPTYNQSWSAEATVSVPLSLDGTLSSYQSWIDNGLTVGFTDTDGRVFHLTVCLSLEPGRTYQSFYSVTDTDGSTYEIDAGTEVATTDESGVVRLRFDAATKTLTAETDTHTLFRLDLSNAGWGMTASDTFAIVTSFSNSGCSISESTPITLDDFHAAITAPTAEQTFTITNTGVGNLHGLRLAKDGLNDADFTLSDLSTTFLTTGQSTTFTVSFAPKGAGARTATLHLLSNDADESPFDISLTGTGGSMAPTVVTQPATGITKTTATLNGLVNSNGSSTTVSFDLGTDTSYGLNVIATPSSVSSGADTVVSAVLTGMTPGTTWHYRVRATNTVGTTLGEDRSFTVPLEIWGEADADFNPNAGGGPTSGVLATALQPDGKMIIGGGFTSIGGTTRNYIARLNADGTTDAFNPNADDTVFSVAVQNDGKILVAGTFFNIGGAARISCARLNADGSADLSFDPNIVGDVFSMALQPDGKIIIAGWFNSVDGVARNNLARLLPNGDLDLAFDPAPNSSGIVNTVALQSDGKIIVAGQFTTMGGNARNRIARLLPDGSLDPAFDAAAGATGPTDYIRAVSIQANGKLVIGGNFGEVNGVFRNRIARLNDNGTLDTTFLPNITGLSVNSVAMQSDGRMIVVGDFTSVGATTRSRMARLNADGSLANGFDQSTNAPLFAATLEADGAVIVGGDFTSIGGVTRNRIARLNNESATQALSATSTDRVEWLRGASAPETQQVSFELSVNGGSTWTLLGTGARISGGWELTNLALPANGQIRGRARVTGGINNGSAGLVETIYIYSGLPVPEIAVFNGAGTAPLDERADNIGTFNFGPQLLGSNVSRTFTIQSTGTATLSAIGVSMSGTGQFSVTAPGAAILATGATTTFTVTFSPTTEGVQSRTVLIASNDADENPFEIQIIGEGQIPPSITTQPVSRLIGLGTASSLSVTATGSALQYQWLRNGKVVPGATAATFVIPSASLGHVGAWRVSISNGVSNGVNAVPSEIVNLGVVDLSTRSVNLTEGDTLNLFVAAGAPGGSYRWMRGGVAIPRGINPETQLTITGIQADLAGAYTCQVTMPDPQNPGTPFVMQSGAITVHVGAGAGATAGKPTLQKPVLLPFSPTPWIVGGAVRDVIPALNAPTRFAVRGLPAGVKLNALTGEISGRPAVAIQVPTRYPLTITASNAAGSSAALKTDVIVQPLPGYSVGSFHGIIERQASLNAGHGGRISLTVTATGSFTGKLTLGAASSSFTGQLATTQIGQDVTAEIRITRAKPLAALNLTFTIQRLTGELTGQVWEQANTVATFSAWRQAEDAAAHVGRFEIALTAAGAAVGDAAYPQTGGTLRLSISRSGVPSWSGRLADGATITGSSSLGRLRAVPLHHFYAPTRSSLQGWLQLSPASDAVDGSLDWLRLFTQTTAPSFPLHELQAAGTRTGTLP